MRERRRLRTRRRPGVTIGRQTVGGGMAHGRTVERGGFDGDIDAGGSSTVWPITDEAPVRLMDLAERVRVAVEISGTGGGFEQFGAGDTELQNASRAIAADEAAACVDEGIARYAFEVGCAASPIEVCLENQAKLEAALNGSRPPDGPP